MVAHNKLGGGLFPPNERKVFEDFVWRNLSFHWLGLLLGIRKKNFRRIIFLLSFSAFLLKHRKTINFCMWFLS